MTYFLRAPHRIGGYEGALKHDICAQMTSLPSHHWIGDNKYECEQRINRAVDGWVVAISFSILALLVTSFVWNFPTYVGNFISGIVACCKPPTSTAPFKPVLTADEIAKAAEISQKIKDGKLERKRLEKVDVFFKQFVIHLNALPSTTTVQAALLPFKEMIANQVCVPVQEPAVAGQQLLK